MSAGVGRAFLVARTPTDGYQLMLGPPEPPVRGLIVRHARPDAGETVAVLQEDATAISMVSRTHRLTTSDLAPGSGGADLVLDEHGRPIDVVYGFVSDMVVVEVAEADLDAARCAALDAYRRVLSGGDPVAAATVRLSSRLAGPAAGSLPVRPLVAARGGSVGRAGRRRPGVSVVAAALVVVAAAAIIAFLTMPTPVMTVPVVFVGTWTGTGGVVLTISCDGPCEVHAGDRIGRIERAGCEYRISVEAVEVRSVIATASAEGEHAGCAAPAELRISASDRPDAVMLDWKGVVPLTLTRV